MYETVSMQVCFSLVISQIRVRMGEWDFSSTTEPNQHVERKVSCDWWRLVT